jgi:formiminotetrahydrofolate cyclodeaminase
MVAASGAALVAMVARICSANRKYAAFTDLAKDLVSQSDALRAELLLARERDEAAFDRVVAATAMPKGTDEEKRVRRDALEIALAHAAAEPLCAAESSLEVLRLASKALAFKNRNLVSDLGCAAEFAYASLAACGYNVRINHRFMSDEAAIEAQENALARYEREALALLSSIRKTVRGQLAPA